MPQGFQRIPLVCRAIACWAVLAVLCAAVPEGIRAQTTGALRGTIFDPERRPLAGATVVLVGPGLPASGRGAVSDASGLFQIGGLAPGHEYQLRASFPGLGSVQISDLAIASGQTTTQTITLQPDGALRERVRVRASPQVVNPETTSTETRLSSEFLEALPILGRNYQDALTLAPGVTDLAGDGNPNIHGARNTDVITLVDGVSTTDPLTGKIGAQLNIESIQEIEVKTAGATAEFGRAQGGFANIITKSGGNEFQGTMKFFWRGNLLDGDGAGADSPRLHGGVGETGLRDLTFNDYLPFLSAGGPILKDRAWYFVTLEYVQKQDPVNALTQAFVTGLREKRAFAKATWQAGAAHRVALSLNYDPQEFLNQGLNSFTREETGYATRQGGPILTLKETAVLSPYSALETTASHFDERPGEIPTLGPDTNGDGNLYFDRNHNGLAEARERDPGEDFDRDGKFDVFEDDDHNGLLGPTEDKDGDRRLTPRMACEGNLREDLDCDGHLDQVNEDLNHNGILDPGEDLDHDNHLDTVNEDRNGNHRLDDTPSPTTTYPYGRLAPLAADRNYTIDLVRGVTSGPFYEEYSDRRRRDTLRQDLSLFVPEARGTHDLRMGFVVEREAFSRTTQRHEIDALQDFAPSGCRGLRCSPPGLPPPTLNVLLPTAPVLQSAASGHTTGLYLQDTYKPRPNLTIGIGLRFDRELAQAPGYTYFDPAAQRRLFDSLNELIGTEVGHDDFLQGNNDGLVNYGIITDPIFLGSANSQQLIGDIAGPIRVASIIRMTRHHDAISFNSPQVQSILSELAQGGSIDPKRLQEAGILAQQPETITLTNNNLAPRLSISWDPWSDGRTKVYATWGRYYDKLFLNTIVGEQGPDAVQRYYSVDRSGLVVAPQTSLDRVTAAVPDHYVGASISQSPPSFSQVARGLQTPWSDELTLGFERELAPEVSLSVRYINRKFRDQLQDVDLNHTTRIDPATHQLSDRIGQIAFNSRGQPRIPDGRPDLFIQNFFFNQILRMGNYNEARYHAIEIEILKRLSRRWELHGSYSYSRALGAAEDFQSRLGNDPSTVEQEFGYLNYDQRHVVKLSSTMYLPGDWQLGFLTSWSSGLPYSIISRFFALDNADYPQLRTRYGFTTFDPARPRFQTVRRNSERNDPVYDFNLRARKGVVIGHKAAAVFLEVFNLLNTDDLRIQTIEPDRGVANPFQTGTGLGFDARSATSVGGLPLDGTRRFGRRFQFGFQIDF